MRIPGQLLQLLPPTQYRDLAQLSQPISTGRERREKSGKSFTGAGATAPGPFPLPPTSAPSWRGAVHICLVLSPRQASVFHLAAVGKECKLKPKVPSPVSNTLDTLFHLLLTVLTLDFTSKETEAPKSQPEQGGSKQIQTCWVSDLRPFPPPLAQWQQMFYWSKSFFSCTFSWEAHTFMKGAEGRGHPNKMSQPSRVTAFTLWSFAACLPTYCD